MIESSDYFQEETRLVMAEQEAKLKRAEFLSKKAVKMFGTLQAGSEHYGSKYGEVLKDLECAHRLVHEATDLNSSTQNPNKARAQLVMHEIEIFCQMNRFIISKEKVELSGLSTVNVKIDSSESAN